MLAILPLREPKPSCHRTAEKVSKLALKVGALFLLGLLLWMNFWVGIEITVLWLAQVVSILVEGI